MIYVGKIRSGEPNPDCKVHGPGGTVCKEPGAPCDEDRPVVGYQWAAWARGERYCGDTATHEEAWAAARAAIA